jgi:MoaA/NifB/PqqE/SkfB family radical SAM enzyme
MAALLPPELLERIWFYTNFDCSLRCSYCVATVAPGTVRPPLALPAFRRLVDQAQTLGFRQVALTGGEPFLHPDIAAMLEYATARVDTVVLTNAMHVTRATLEALQRVERSQLTMQVSLDSADERVNDRLRGRGTWRVAMRNLELLLQAGYAVAVRATLDGQDEQTLAGLTQCLGTLGMPADRVYGAVVAKVGRATHGLELSPEGVWPEPTLISDGLYWHPLLIEPTMAVTLQTEPLEHALETLAAMVERIKPSRPAGVR